MSAEAPPFYTKKNGSGTATLTGGYVEVPPASRQGSLYYGVVQDLGPD
jgi:hypothetical protein